MNAIDRLESLRQELDHLPVIKARIDELLEKLEAGEITETQAKNAAAGIDEECE